MNLPKKYRGATSRPWKVYDKDGGNISPGIYSVSERCSIIMNGHTGNICGVLGRTKKQAKANARLIADAPMLACRVVALEELLSRVLPYAESRAEDLTEFKEAGQEDPEFPGADEAWLAVQDGYAALAASPFGLVADSQNDNQPAAYERRAEAQGNE